MREIIDQHIAAKFESKEEFSKLLQLDPKNLSSKLKTVEKRIDWLDAFLKPLGLKVQITPTND